MAETTGEPWGTPLVLECVTVTSGEMAIEIGSCPMKNGDVPIVMLVNRMVLTINCGELSRDWLGWGGLDS